MDSLHELPPVAQRRPSTSALPANVMSDGGPEIRSRLREFLEYWEMKRRIRGQLPRRADMDPADILALLPDIFLVNTTYAEADLVFQFRLLGENVGRINSRIEPGVLITDAFPRQTAKILCKQCRRVTWTREPEFRIVPAADHDGRLKRLAHALAPLAEDGENVDALIGLAIDTSLPQG